MTKPKVVRQAHIFECPWCLSMECGVDGNDFDDHNQKGRSRVCPNCGMFSTVEVAVMTPDGKPVPLAQWGTNKRQQQRDSQRIRKGYRAVGARYTTGNVTVTARYVSPTRQPYQMCWRGHPFNSDNTYVNPHGGRSCRPCKRIAQAEYKLVHPERVRARQRASAQRQRARRAAERAAAATGSGAAG